MKRNLFTLVAVLALVASVSQAQNFLSNAGIWGRPSQLQFAEYKVSTNGLIVVTNTDSTAMLVPVEAIVRGSQWGGSGTNAAFNATNTISATLAVSGYHAYALGSWTGLVVGSESPISLATYPPMQYLDVLTLTNSPAITTNVLYVGIYYFAIPKQQ